MLYWKTYLCVLRNRFILYRVTAASLIWTRVKDRSTARRVKNIPGFSSQLQESNSMLSPAVLHVALLGGFYLSLEYGIMDEWTDSRYVHFLSKECLNARISSIRNRRWLLLLKVRRFNWSYKEKGKRGWIYALLSSASRRWNNLPFKVKSFTFLLRTAILSS